MLLARLQPPARPPPRHLLPGSRRARPIVGCRGAKLAATGARYTQLDLVGRRKRAPAEHAAYAWTRRARRCCPCPHGRRSGGRPPRCSRLLDGRPRALAALRPRPRAFAAVSWKGPPPPPPPPPASALPRRPSAMPQPSATRLARRGLRADTAWKPSWILGEAAPVYSPGQRGPAAGRAASACALGAWRTTRALAAARSSKPASTYASRAETLETLDVCSRRRTPLLLPGGRSATRSYRALAAQAAEAGATVRIIPGGPYRPPGSPRLLCQGSSVFLEENDERSRMDGASWLPTMQAGAPSARFDSREETMQSARNPRIGKRRARNVEGAWERR